MLSFKQFLEADDRFRTSGTRKYRNFDVPVWATNKRPEREPFSKFLDLITSREGRSEMLDRMQDPQVRLRVRLALNDPDVNKIYGDLFRQMLQIATDR